MPKSDNQKVKILYIRDYLRINSTQEHPVSTTELIEMLDSHDIHADRKTVFSDVQALIDFGEEIEVKKGRSGGYYLASRRFETSELTLLIDAVQCSRYLDEKTSSLLINKLLEEFGSSEARKIRETVYVQGRIKSMNDSVYTNVDKIQQALVDARKITFRYFSWGLNRKRIYRDKVYTVSPYGLCQSNENCYLIALSPDHERPVHYRVDRMSDIEVTSEKRQVCPELTGKALNDYVRKQFNMYSGEVQQVKMRFRRHLVNVVLDTFDAGVMLIPDGPDWFTVTASVAVSPQFLGWIVGLGDGVKILYPENVIQGCRELCRNIQALYEED